MRDLRRMTALADRGRELLSRNVRADIPTNGPWYRIEAAAGGRTTVRLYGFIGDEWDGVTASAFMTELDAIGKGGIDLHINSGGGSVFDGVSIYSALKNHPSDVTSYVDGVAASAASFVAMAGDEIVMEKPAKLMVHDASGLVLGNKYDMREMLDLLDELDGTIADIYADRTGKPASQWAAAMDANRGGGTWYSSAAAVEAGLADRVANDNAATESPATDRATQLIRARARATLRG